MAEVSAKLQSGVYRLSALRTNQSGAVCAGRSPGSPLVTCTCRVKEESAQPGSRRRAPQRQAAIVCTVKTRTGKQEDDTSELKSSRCIGLFNTMHSHQTAPRVSVLQQKLLYHRTTVWTREALSFSPDTSGSPQQPRAFCTFILLLSDQGSESVRYQRLHRSSSATGRSYSWASDSRSTDAPLLYRSRTAYYDILKVSPGATQSQIKSAYYKQSFIYHPDKNPGSKEATKLFSQIAEAYSILGNISLRRKYDRGTLSQSDVQSAGRPTAKEATSRPAGPPQRHQQRASGFSRPGGKPIYDFDAFYQAHYGEQLQKERDMRARKEQMREKEKQKLDGWREGKMSQMVMFGLLATASLIFVSMARS